MRLHDMRQVIAPCTSKLYLKLSHLVSFTCLYWLYAFYCFQLQNVEVGFSFHSFRIQEPMLQQKIFL